jgi:hypothetical protein
MADPAADERVRQRIEECLRRHREDPRPGVRVSALVGTFGDEPSAADLVLFARELDDPQAHWEFVAWCGRLDWRQQGDASRARVVAALTQLRDQGWTQRVVPGEYPYQLERAEMLTTAINAVQST